MPRQAHPWFRFYVEAVRDPKIRRLTPEQRWLWVAILSAARESPISGYLMVSERHAYDWNDLADYAGVKLRVVEEGTARMSDLGMLVYDDRIGAWCVRAWSDRQFESDDVTARTRKHRERSTEQDGNVPTSAVGTPPETEAETESETDGSAPPKRRTTAPNNLLVTEPMRDWARDHSLTVDLARETDKFLNYHRSKGTRFSDWVAAWRNWMLKAQDFAPKRPSDTEYV